MKERLAKLIDVKIALKFKKPLIEESDMGVSKRGLIYASIAFIVMVLILLIACAAIYAFTGGLMTL